eukprot:GAHX01001056.1.p1 GENE.GAHX01001056.1~~GAHX01001056.1.p1  ORF type:complete len:662 (-),score=158.09 GAHX01001056.1:117-2102(-)
MTDNNFQEYTIKTRRPLTRSMSASLPQESSSQDSSQEASQTIEQESLALPKSTEPYTSTDVVDIQEKLSFDEQMPAVLISDFLSNLPSRNFVNLFISFLRDSDISVRQFITTDFLNNTPKTYASFFIAYKREHGDFYTLPDLIEKRTKVLTRLSTYISSNIDNTINRNDDNNNDSHINTYSANEYDNNELEIDVEPQSDNSLFNSDNEISKLSKKLESVIFSSQSFIFNDYKQKAFILLQNLKNNKELCSELLSGAVNLSQLMTMKEEEFANSNIRKQRFEISQQTFNERVIKKEDHYFSISSGAEVFDDVVERLPASDVEEGKDRRAVYRYHFSTSVLKSQVYPSFEIKAIEIHSELSNDIQLSELAALSHYKIKQLLEGVKETGISGNINVEKIVVYINHLLGTKKRIIIPFRIANSAKRTKQFLLFRQVLNESRKTAVVDLEQSHGMLFYLFPYLDTEMAVKNDSVVGNLYSNLINLLGIDLMFARQKGFENDGFCLCIIDPERSKRVQPLNSKANSKQNFGTENNNSGQTYNASRRDSGRADSNVQREIVQSGKSENSYYTNYTQSKTGYNNEYYKKYEEDSGYNDQYDYGYGYKNEYNYNIDYNGDGGSANKGKRSSFGGNAREIEKENGESVNKRAKVYKPKYEKRYENDYSENR